MKIRKIMTAITATAMAGVMFAGCSSSNGGSSAGSSADSSSQRTAAPQRTTAAQRITEPVPER